MPTRSSLLFLNQVMKEYKSKNLAIQQEVILKEYSNKAILGGLDVDLYEYLSGSNKPVKVDEKGLYKQLYKYCKDLEYQINNLPL